MFEGLWMWVVGVVLADSGPAWVPSVSYPHRRRRVLVAFGSFALCACEAGTTPRLVTAVQDSAGVTIVENRGRLPPDGGGWAVDPEPGVVIGSLAGPEEAQLFRVRGATRIPDGRIAVGNDGTKELRIYGADGAYLTALGGKGEGPGEFASVQLTGLLGDSLVVFDRRLRRVSLFHPDEGFVRSFLLAEPMANYPLGAWLFGSGSLLIRDLPLDESTVSVDGYHRTAVPLKSCDMSGALLADFGVIPGAEQLTITGETEQGIVSSLRPVPFGRSPQIAVAGNRMYLGAQDAFEIEVFGSDASLRRIIRLDRAAVAVTGADMEAWVRDQVAELEDPNAARMFRGALEEAPLPETRPAHGAVFADQGGYVFVEDYRMPADRVPVLNVFDPEGRLVGRMGLAEGLEVVEVGEDYLLGLHRDEMGVETLRLYGLRRPSRHDLG